MRFENTKFEVVCKSDSAEIFIYGPIGPWDGGVSAEAFIGELKRAKNARSIDIRINSPGGSVTDAQAIVTALRSHGAKINTFIDGTAASAASFIAMAGDTIEIAQHGFIMIHDPSGGMDMQLYGTASMFREVANKSSKYADVLDAHADMIAKVYASRTGLPVDELRAMMAEEKWLGADEAVAKKFADRIGSQLAVAASGFDFFNYKKMPKELLRLAATPEELGRRELKNKLSEVDSKLQIWRTENVDA